MLKHFVCFAVLALPVSAGASPIQFDFRDASIEVLDGFPTLSLTRDGITLTASTLAGIFNRTSTGFGVNADGSGDDTDALDGGTGVLESIDFIFDADVILAGFGVSGLGSSDRGIYSINGLAPVTFSATGLYSLGQALLPVGQPFSIQFSAGNGFSVDSLTVSAVEVSEPDSLWLALPLVCLLLIRRLRQRPAGHRSYGRYAVPA